MNSFFNLMRQLGEQHPQIYKLPGGEHWQCRLPFQPVDRLRGFEGNSIRFSNLGYVVIEIPVEEGLARIVGRIQLESDGLQTLREVIAARVDAVGDNVIV